MDYILVSPEFIGLLILFCCGMWFGYKTLSLLVERPDLDDASLGSGSLWVCSNCGKLRGEL